MNDEVMEILLVEDDPQDVELTLRVLQSEHVKNRVQVARDGEEALDYLFRRGPFAIRPADTHPRLVLLDLKLPKVDGLSVLRALKGDHRTRWIPVIVLTSSKEERDLTACYELGVNSYIQKPVDFEQFREAVHTLALYWLLVNQPPPGRSLPDRAEESA